MKTKFLIVFLLLVMVLVLPVSAAETVTKIYEYETEDPENEFLVSDRMEEDGVSYQLQSQEKKVISTTIPKKVDLQKVDLGTHLTKESVTQNEMVIDGVTYTLQEISYTEGTVDNRIGSYTHQVTYADVIKEPEAAQSLPISFVDQTTNETVMATVELREVRQNSEWHWVDDLRISVKATPHESLYFRIGETLIPNDEQLNITGAESEILKELGLNEQSYVLNRAEWNGEIQTAEDGSSYREAVIYGSRYVASFVAEYYADQIPLPDTDGYNAQAIYRGEVDDLENASYTVQVTAIYTPVKSYTAPIAIGTTSVVACGILLFVLFTRRNVLVHQNEKPIYKTRVRKNTIVIPDRVILARNPGRDLFVTIKKGYTKHHIGETVTIVSNRVPTVDEQIQVAGNIDILFRKQDFLK